MVVHPKLFQSKLGYLELDIEDGDEGHEVLEMVLATYVQRLWEKVKAQKTKEKKAAQAAAQSQKEQEKKEENNKMDGQGSLNAGS